MFKLTCRSLTACIVYYYFWINLIPRYKGYEFRQTVVQYEDGSIAHQLVKVPKTELSTWDSQHDATGRSLTSTWVGRLGSCADQPRNALLGVHISLYAHVHSTILAYYIHLLVTPSIGRSRNIIESSRTSLLSPRRPYNFHNKKKKKKPRDLRRPLRLARIGSTGERPARTWHHWLPQNLDIFQL